MSTPASAPFISPWAADWNRYSTQLYNMGRVNATMYRLTIPVGQWWRIIYSFAQWNTSAVSATRLNILEFQVQNGTVTPFDTRFAAPTTQAASKTGLYYYGILSSTFSVAETTTTTYNYTPLPDIVWPQSTVITMTLDNGDGGDVAPSPPFVATEIYTENTDGTLAPTVAPTPLVA